MLNPNNITRMVYQQHTRLDDGRLMVKVVEHSERVSWFGWRRQQEFAEVCYVFIPGVGRWADDAGRFVLIMDPRTLMLSQIAMHIRTVAAIDREVGLAT
jgi:hypothetical protein